MPNLNIIQQPDLLSASENPIFLKLSTDDTGRNSLKAKFFITVATSLDPGDKITFYFREPQFLSKTFVASSFPTAQNEFFASDIISPTNSGTTSVSSEEIMINLTEKLRQDVFIGNFYDVNYFGGSVVLSAKFAGNEFTLLNTTTDGYDATNNVVYSNVGGIVRTSFIEGSSPIEGENQKNYSLYADVYVNSNKLVNLRNTEPYFVQEAIGSLRKPFIKNGQNLVEFDISTLLKNYVTTAIPTIGNNAITKVGGERINTNPIVGYSIEFGEYLPLSDSIDGLIMQKVPKSRIVNKSVINGAVNYGQNYSDYYPVSGASTFNYMTNQPNTKLTHPSISIDPLYYVFNNQENVGSVTFIEEAIVNYYDGTSETITQLENTFDNVNLFNDEEYDEGLDRWLVSGVTDTDTTWLTGSGGVYRDNYIYVSGSNVSTSPIVYQDFGDALLDNTQLIGELSIRNDSTDATLSGVVVADLMGWNGIGWITLDSKQVFATSAATDVYFIVKTGTIDSYSFIGLKIDVPSANDYDNLVVYVDYFKLFTNDSVGMNGVYYLDARPDHLGINSQGILNGKKVKDYSVEVSASTSGFTLNSQTYYLPYDVAPKGTTVNWQNPVGGFDSFYFTGIREDSISRTSDAFEVVVDKNYPDGFQKNKQYNIDSTDDLVVNSGWIKEDHMDWMKEILSSPKVYIATSTSIDYYIVSGFQYVKNNQNNQYNMELTLTKTIENNNITE